MSRFLFVVLPLAGRVRPTVPVGRELAARGHEVAWTGHREVLDGLVPEGATVIPAVGPVSDDAFGDGRSGPAGSLRSPAGLMLLWNDFLLPLARSTLAGVQAAVDRFAPDALVVDQHALAGTAVAHLSGLPWATTVPTAAGLADPFWDLPQLAKTVRRRVRRFLREAGLDDLTAARADPQFSPHLVVAFSTEALAGRRPDLGDRCAFVGPCLAGPDAVPVPFNWDWLDPGRRLVLVAVETPHGSLAARLVRAAARALATLDVQAVIVAPPDLFPDPPANVLVVPRAPRRALARRAAAVVCDGGHDTACEALAHAVPLVVDPMTGDQPIVADQVVSAGAAVPAHQAGPTRLRRAVETALDDPGVRRGARRLQDSFARAGGAGAAADRLEALVEVTAALP